MAAHGSTTSTSTTTTGVAAAPSAQTIAATIATTHEVTSPNEGFSGGTPVTVGDGHGGSLTAVVAGRTPSADGHGWLVFFWHDGTFLGWDTDQESWNVSVSAHGPDGIQATYPQYAPKDPACCPSLPPFTTTYSWNGTKLSHTGQLPPGVIVGIMVERDCVASGFVASSAGTSAALGNDLSAVNLTNVSSRPCFASGYPTVYGRNAGGALQALSAKHGTYFGDVTPGSVAPHQPAIFLLATSSGCEASGPPTQTYSAVVIALANGSGDVTLDNVTLDTTCSLAISQIGSQRTNG